MENTKHKILVIEDNKVDQMAFTRMVEEKKLPYDCTLAGSVSQAKDLLGSEKFDVIIADYLLGGGTALDVLALVKDVPVIFVTGAGDEEVAIQAWKSGACDYLVKDHEQNYLKTVPITIENALRHKRTEERLKLLSHAIMSTDDSICIADMADKIIFVNRAFCETYGYSEEEILGKESDILWENSKAQTSYQAVDGWEVAFYHKRKDGTEFPVSLTRSDIKDENGIEVAIVSVARDISERINIEDHLRAENSKLKKLLGAKANAKG